MARIKGVNLVSVLKALRKARAVVPLAVPDHLQSYFDERILVSTWYPEEDALDLMRMLVGVMPVKGKAAWQMLGKTAAIEQAQSTYRSLIASREVVRIVERCNVLWRSHHDTGELSVVVAEDKLNAVIMLDRYDLLGEEWCHIMCGFCAGIVQTAGAVSPICTLAACDLERRQASWRLSWEGPA